MPDLTQTKLHAAFFDDELLHDCFNINNFYIFSDEPFASCGSPEAGALGLDNPRWPTSTTPTLSAPTTPEGCLHQLQPQQTGEQ
eukprot:3938132-Rhodomonas_salina.1